MNDTFYKVKEFFTQNIKNRHSLSFNSTEYELFNNLDIFSFETQLKKIEDEIERFANLLDKGYPFVAYNFNSGILNETIFFDNHVSTIVVEIWKEFDEERQNIEPHSEEYEDFLLEKAIILIRDKESNFNKILNRINIEYSRAKILESIITKKNELLENKNKHSNPSNSIPTSIISDLSDTIGTEKIIMLHKLGVLEFLKQKEPFNLSTNALASAISGITGIKQQSVYPMINPIFNPENDQKNNPLTTDKTVNKVIQKLINLGFNLHD